MMNEMLDTRLKTILALSGRANTGKTQTIKKVCRLLLEAYPDAQVSWVHPKEAPVESFDGDICLFMEIGGTLIGVESQGDPKSRLPQSLKMFAEHQPPCDVILCATRTWGSTCQAVKQLRTVDNYDIVRISKKLRVTNDEYANHILALIENLLAGKETQP